MVDVLTKPSPPEVILSTVDAALHSITHLPGTWLDRAVVGREHLQLATSTCKLPQLTLPPGGRQFARTSVVADRCSATAVDIFARQPRD
jgi:hypothetical protein